VYAAVTRKLIYSLWRTVFNFGNYVVRNRLHDFLPNFTIDIRFPVRRFVNVRAALFMGKDNFNKKFFSFLPRMHYTRATLCV